MFVAMATAMHIWTTHFLETHFKCFCKRGIWVCGLFVQSMRLHTHQRGSYMVWEINMGVCPRLNLMIQCLLVVWGMAFIFMVHLCFDAIPLLIYDAMYDITTIP